jgi:hypothetical protein
MSVAAPQQLARAFVGASASLEVRDERIKSDVYRMWCTSRGATQSFVAKRLDPDIAHRNELVCRRWLPAVGLGDAGPPLLAVAAETDGSSVWHLYEDLGDCGLDAADADGVGIAIATIARIHSRFIDHALIPECRLWGGDLGISFYTSSVRDAITSLRALLARGPRLDSGRAGVCDRLETRLTRLFDERDARTEALARGGGPETVLHGDLWPMNVMVVSHDERRSARLIDWDHAAVGPVSYDLSTFLSRVPSQRRRPILDLYEDEVRHAGWRLPSPADLNVAFETAELGRIANRVIWPAVAAWETNAAWAFDMLAEVERWFEQLTPVLPQEPA